MDDDTEKKDIDLNIEDQDVLDAESVEETPDTSSEKDSSETSDTELADAEAAVDAVISMASDHPIDDTLAPIVDEMKKSYLNYAMSVIVQRALPDVRDGLKPVPVSYTHLDVYKRQPPHKQGLCGVRRDWKGEYGL